MLKVNVERIDTVDLLFVVDNSGSMQEEQEKLKEQLPRLVEILTSGDKSGDGRPDFAPARDLHLGVVSTDMGLPDVVENIDPQAKCQGIGDDGQLQHQAEASTDATACPGTDGSGLYPLFLSHSTGDDDEALVHDFGCISTLGIDGCGFEMPLEAALKALWPAAPANLLPEQQQLGITFLRNRPPHGDGTNQGFLRGVPYNEPEQVSLLGIVVVSDEEDCSAGANGDLGFLEHPDTASEDFALTPANLRCYQDGVLEAGNRYPVERYVEAFKALRPSIPNLVVFAGILGIPTDLEADADGDGTVTPREQNTYYEEILDHPLMQERVRDDDQNLELVCVHENPDYDPNYPDVGRPYTTEAFPARRMVEVARAFGQRGVVQSICQDDFAPAVDAIIEAISGELGSICLTYDLERDEDGLVECEVVWEMPAGLGCNAEYLTPHPKHPVSEDGDALCVVDQLAVNTKTLTVADGLGWYWDDFSPALDYECKEAGQKRVAFVLSGGADTAPAGVVSRLECPNVCVGIE
jgi:hypothetical protein